MKPFKHQTLALQRMTKANLAVFHDCGSGKTATALWLCEYHISVGRGPCLIVAPKSILESAWMADAAKFVPSLCAINIWDKKPSERERKLSTHADIYITSFEQFKIMYPKLMAKGFQTIIIDESSKMKNPKAEITRALLSTAGVKSRGYRVTPIIPHRYVLSGTPAPNNMGEYWAQIMMVTGPGVVGHALPGNYYVFRSMYFWNKLLPNGARIWRFRESMGQQLLETIKPYADIVRKEDAIDLPEQVHSVREVTLSAGEAKTYKTLKEEMVLMIAGQTILAENVLSEIMKLRQITSGFVYVEGGTEQVGASKLKELDALLTEIGDQQVIIWCNFKAEIHEIGKMLDGCVTLYADTKDREDSIEKFKSGKAQYLLANPQSAGHGLTFVNCSYAVYFSQTYSYELLKQSQDRIHRIGQKDKCTYYYLLAKGTIDEAIYATVTGKGDMSTAALAYLRGQGCLNKRSNARSLAI